MYTGARFPSRWRSSSVYSVSCVSGGWCASGRQTYSDRCSLCLRYDSQAVSLRELCVRNSSCLTVFLCPSAFLLPLPHTRARPHTPHCTTVIPVTAQPGQGGVPVYPQNQTVLNGTSVTFVCTIPGADSVAWMDEKSTPVVADGQRVSVSVSGLTIDPVDYRQDQHGFYCVGVFNGERNVTTKSPVAYLNVHCELKCNMHPFTLCIHTYLA